MLTTQESVADDESGNDRSRSGKTTKIIDSAIDICRLLVPTAARIPHARRLAPSGTEALAMAAGPYLPPAPWAVGGPPVRPKEEAARRGVEWRRDRAPGASPAPSRRRAGR